MPTIGSRCIPHVIRNVALARRRRARRRRSSAPNLPERCRALRQILSPPTSRRIAASALVHGRAAAAAGGACAWPLDQCAAAMRRSTLIAPVDANPLSDAQSLQALVGRSRRAAGRDADRRSTPIRPMTRRPTSGSPTRSPRSAFSVHLGLHDDETARALPLASAASHALESWSDLRVPRRHRQHRAAADPPLYDTRTAHDLLGLLDGTSVAVGLRSGARRPGRRSRHRRRLSKSGGEAVAA